MAACDPHCTFPKPAGLPSAGYRCADLNADGHEDCETTCLNTYEETLSDCYSDYDACLLTCGGDGDCIYGCEATLCSCRGSTEKARSDCQLGCDITSIPDWMACSAGDVDANASCCDTTLGTCYQTCEDTFLAAMAPVELAYWGCQKTAYEVFYNSVAVDVMGVCDMDLPLLILQDCESAHYLASEPFLEARDICRASCETDEINRDAPEDRKTAECGGRYHLCEGKALAHFHGTLTGCGHSWYLCNDACSSLQAGSDLTLPDNAFQSCLVACANAFYDCARDHVKDFADARYTCCTQEHDHVRHMHQYDRCWLDKWRNYWNGAIDAQKDCLTCLDGCASSDTACQAACLAARLTARSAAQDEFETEIEDCNLYTPDCPNCGKDALVDISNMGYSGATLGGIVTLGFLGTPELPPMGFPSTGG